MKRHVLAAIIDNTTGPLAWRAPGRRDHGWSVKLGRARDRLLLGLAVMTPPDNAALNVAYAEAMVEVFDEWFALNGQRAGGGPPR